MNSRNTVNVVIVVAVILAVVGTAWWKHTRSAEPTPKRAPAAASVSAPPPPASQPAPTARGAASAPAASQPASRPASQPTSQAGADRLPRLVDLGAGKCLACKKLAPILDALREEYKGRLSVVFYDVWKDPAPARKYGVRLIPTQILFDRNGREVWRHEGFISKDALKKLFAEKVGVKEPH